MANSIQIFENSEFGSIRVMEANNEGWFIGKEIASILAYSNTRDAVRKHVDKGDKATAAIHDGRQNRHYIIINESGLYSLVLGSKLPAAKRFKRWITSDVLVSIRKQGSCTTVRALHPAVAFGAAIGNCRDAILIRDYAKIFANANVKIGQDKLFKWLHSKGYIYRDKRTDQWMTYKKYIDMGIFLVSQSKIKIPNFGDKLAFTIKITGIGQRYFYEELRIEYLIN